MAKEGKGRAAVAAELDMDEAALRKASKENLVWNKDYWMHPHDRARYSDEAVAKLKALFAAEPDEVVWARIWKQQPPNKRRMYIVVPGEEGKQECNIPIRMQKLRNMYRKQIPVRKVDENVYELAYVNWRTHGQNG